MDHARCPSNANTLGKWRGCNCSQAERARQSYHTVLSTALPRSHMARVGWAVFQCLQMSVRQHPPWLSGTGACEV